MTEPEPANLTGKCPITQLLEREFLSEQKILILSKVAGGFLCSFHKFTLNNLFSEIFVNAQVVIAMEYCLRYIYGYIFVDIRPDLGTRETLPVFFFFFL